MGGEACRAHAQKRPVNRQWRWVSGKMKWFHTYRLPSAKLEPEEKLLEGAVADVSWLVSPRVATQNRPVGYVFCCCFLFYTYSLTIPDIPIIAKSVGPIFDKFSWLDELLSYEPMTVDNQSEIGFFNPSQVCCHGNQILLVYMYCIICMSVTGRTRLVAQSGELTLDFALHLGFISTCFNIWKFLLVPAYPGCPGSKAVKRSLLLLLLLFQYKSACSYAMFVNEWRCDGEDELASVNQR